VIRTLYRLLFVLFLVAGALRGSAQNVADVAVWIIDAELPESTPSDDEGDSTLAAFNEEVGHAISTKPFWTELDVTSLTLLALWHFNRDDNVADPAPERVRLQADITWSATAGVNVCLTER